MGRIGALGAIVLAAIALGGCRQGPAVREYVLKGQITAIDRQTGYVTVRHEDIKGFMPGMTMPFAVRDRSLLDGHQPGDLIEAALRVQDTDAWIARMTRTGSAPLPLPTAAGRPGLSPGTRVPDQRFRGDDGQPMSLDWLEGHAAAITFTYTRCPLPDFCPAIDSRFRQLQASLRGERVRLLSVTIDPVFDTPDVLAAHASRVGADPATWRFVATRPEELASFGHQFGLDVRQDGRGPADIEHNLRTIVLDRNRVIVEIVTGAAWSASALADRLRTVSRR